MRNACIISTLAAACRIAPAIDAAEPRAGRTTRTVEILATTDLHGALLPWDYYRGKATGGGSLAMAATLVAEERRKGKADSCLLLDCGDTFQGTPLAYYSWRLQREGRLRLNPILASMEILGYTCMTPGNHEFNYGFDYVKRLEAASSFPWICCNVRDGDDSCVFVPSMVVKTGDSGPLVGITGVCAPGVEVWEAAEHIRGLSFLDPIECAASQAQRLRRRGCDAVVVLVHGGFGPPVERRSDYLRLRRHPPASNVGIELARSVPEADVVLCGHTHTARGPRREGNALLLEGGPYGSTLMKVKLRFVGDERGWTLVSAAGENLKVEGLPLHPLVERAARRMHEYAEKRLAERICRMEKALSAEGCAYEDNALLDLIHRIQLAVSGADVSICSLLPDHASLPAGTVTMRDVYSLYRYDNALIAVKMTGRRLKEHLETSAAAYEVDADGGVHLKEGVPFFNVDTMEGIEYVVDPARPCGERIVSMTRRGTPVHPDDVFLVVVNGYRRNGAGGYETIRTCPTVERVSDNIRETIASYLERHAGELPLERTGNWRLTTR